MGFLEFLFGTEYNKVGYNAECAKKKTEEVRKANMDKEYKDIHYYIDIAVKRGENKTIRNIKYEENVDALKKIGYTVCKKSSYYGYGDDNKYEISW